MNPAPSNSRPIARPLRIIQYCPEVSLSLGGVVRAVLDWCSVLARRGNQVILVTYNSPDVPADWDGSPGKPKVVWLPSGKANWFVSSDAVSIWDQLLTPGSVAHLHCPWTPSNVQMSRAARRRGVPYIVSIHGMLDDWSMQRRGLKKRIFLAVGGRRFLTLADRVHYTANAERDQGQRWIPNATPLVLPYLIDLRAFDQLPGPEIARSKFGLTTGVPTLLFLSRLHEKKGVDILIDAADLLRKSGRAFKVIIAGSAADADREYQSKLSDQVKRLNLEDTVRFVGLVTGTHKLSLYQAADLFVLPTLQENFGLVLIEAMAASTPVLTTRGTDIWREIISCGGNVSENTPSALCAAMQKLLNDPLALARSGQSSRALVMNRFNVDRLANEYESLYARIISEHKPYLRGRS
jgi:glycosyltransferase involved in cell wall biosynthesis